MKVAIIVGTRPEIIKMSPVIKACEAKGIDYALIHTEQHYSRNMSDVFFAELDLPKPHHLLKATSGSHAQQIASMLESFEKLFAAEIFDVALVQGDTNTVLAGSLMATRKDIPVGHVEAGLRSGDRTMPEEINRIMADHLSTYLFTPSDDTLQNLEREGISSESAWNTGNTIVDATFQGLALAKRKHAKKLALTPKTDYLLLTLHRPATVDSASVIQDVLEGVAAVMRRARLAAIFPVHPRTKKQIDGLHIAIPPGMQLIDPVGYLDFLQLQSGAQLIMTDSGGIQEEACILRTPCVTLRDNTERPETLNVGANTLGGTKKQHIIRAAQKMLHTPRDWAIPYGDGRAGERIIDIIVANAQLA